MDPDMCRNLIKWLQTVTDEKSRSPAEISDGIAMYNALVQAAPEHFEKYATKLKSTTNPHKSLKVSNLKKINEWMLDYYQNVLGLQIVEGGIPDLSKIAENNDLIQIGKMLRLILGCAVNCERRQDYIKQIMALEESLQCSLMKAIQQLEDITNGQPITIMSMLNPEMDVRMKRLQAELDMANNSKQMLLQQIRTLEHQISVIQDEKQTLITEFEQVKSQMQDRHVTRPSENGKQVEMLKEEIFNLEMLIDDYRARTLEQEKQINSLREQANDLKHSEDVIKKLKDDIDALTETADRVPGLENNLALCKKKLDEYGDLKKENQKLEEKLSEYVQLNLKYEKEMKEQNLWRNQTEIYKNQIVDLQQKLDEQISKTDRVEFINKNLESKCIAAVAEKDRLNKSVETLREEMEELKLGKSERGGTVSQELAPTELKQRLKFLENENATLREKNQDVAAMQAFLDDANARVKKLMESNRAQNQRILELEAQLEEQKPNEQSAGRGEKVVQLQEALDAKDKELKELQAKYDKALQKTRIVATMFDESNGSLGPFIANNMKADEEKLMVSAFYRLSSACQREATNEHVAMLSGGQGSFLTRQRQPTPRKLCMTYKSK